MRLPRKDTRSFALLRAIFEGAQTADEISAAIGREQGMRNRINENVKNALEQGYIVQNGNKFALTDDIESYVAEVMETVPDAPKENLVPSRSHSFYTPELRNYHKKLFEGKRGY